MAQLEGKVALVTGAARGQGAAEARMFIERGARVIVTDVLDDAGRALCAELGSAAAYHHLDVSDETSWDAVAKFVESRFGELDVLVNNAAVCLRTGFEEGDMGNFDLQYQVNQRGVFLGIRAMVPLMKRKGGSIVNIASASGIKAMNYFAGYVATKYAVRGITKVAALDLARYNIRVNAVIPGFVDTPMIEGPLADPAVQLQVSKLPAQRVGSPEEIARMVCFLASDESSYSTGSDFVVDGGLLTGVLK